MNHYRQSTVIISCILCAIMVINLRGSHLVNADQLDSDGHADANHSDNASCDANDVCHDQQTEQEQHQRQQQYYKDSKMCESSPQSNTQPSSVGHFYQKGISAQAYKPNAPVKTNVCQVHEILLGEANPNKLPHNVAHWTSWRSSYDDVMPVIVHGSIYSCGSLTTSSSPLLSSNDAATMEVWQPRPDGTYSSLRSGVEEGDCRANVPITKPNDHESSNFLGQVQYETLAPGSPGILGGLVPGSSGEYPPYGPGAIQMYLNMEGYYPFLGQLDMNELELQEDSEGRFRFKGWDMRPHARKSGKNNIEGHGGIDIQSVKKASRPRYDLALEVKVDIFLAPIADNDNVEGNAIKKKSAGLNEVFCSPYYGLFSWISSFFKEPIAICFPSLLDFYAL